MFLRLSLKCAWRIRIQISIPKTFRSILIQSSGWAYYIHGNESQIHPEFPLPHHSPRPSSWEIGNLDIWFRTCFRLKCVNSMNEVQVDVNKLNFIGSLSSRSTFFSLGLNIFGQNPIFLKHFVALQGIITDLEIKFWASHNQSSLLWCYFISSWESFSLLQTCNRDKVTFNTGKLLHLSCLLNLLINKLVNTFHAQKSLYKKTSGFEWQWENFSHQLNSRRALAAIFWSML